MSQLKRDQKGEITREIIKIWIIREDFEGLC